MRAAAGAVALLVGAAIGGYVLGTSQGAWLLTRLILHQKLPADALTIGRRHGSLLTGLHLHEVMLRKPRGLPDGSVLTIQEATIGPVTSLNPKRLALALDSVNVTMPGVIESVSVRRIEGSVLQGVTCADLMVENFRGVPDGTVLTVQRIDLLLPVAPQRIRAVHNGKLQLPYSEPIVFFGKQERGALDVRAYSRTLDAEEILEFFPTRGPMLRGVSGQVRDVEAHVTGNWRRPLLTGQFRVVKLVRKNFALLDAPGTASLEFQNLRRLGGKPLHAAGELVLVAGMIASKQTVIRLDPSKLLFSGSLRAPTYDMRGTSIVEGTTIHVALKGTKDHPDLKLTSVPPMLQLRLLIMLATGKNWEASEAGWAEGEISTDLVEDFIDYAFFGGRGSKLAHRVGITDVSLLYDAETGGIGAKTLLFDRFGAEYKLEQSNETDIKAGTTQKHILGAEYRLNEGSSIQLEGEKDLTGRQPQSGTSTTTAAPDGKTTPERESLLDRILLKYKRRF